MKRSGQPPFWLLFGAGGMLSALVGWMLVLLTGIAAPLGIGLPEGFMGYAPMIAFARSLAGKAFLFLVVALFLWHAAHRIHHSLHDLGVRTGRHTWWACYGVALLGTVVAGAQLLAIGFQPP